MNVQEYISSGIIESYVLGLASSEERREFESMCKQYPEILQARIDFELVLEKQAMQNTIVPSSIIKDQLLEKIGPKETSATPVVKMRTYGWLKFAAAACLVLLAASLYWNISLQKENKQIKADLTSSNNELAQLQQDMKPIIGNPAMKMASMKGMPASPQSYTTVYWDTLTHDVYIMVNNLPQPASDKQYQIWALLNGKPIDLGLIDNRYFIKQSTSLVRAKNVQNAQAFAISLEKTGGSSKDTPEGQIYVLGNL